MFRLKLYKDKTNSNLPKHMNSTLNLYTQSVELLLVSQQLDFYSLRSESNRRLNWMGLVCTPPQLRLQSRLLQEDSRWISGVNISARQAISHLSI